MAWYIGTPSSAEPVTPFSSPQDWWTKWRRDPELRAAWWKGMAFSLVLLQGLSLVGLILLGLRPALLPYEVRTDAQGQVISVAPMRPYRPQEEQLREVVKRWVKNTRWLPLDSVVLRNQWQEAMAMSTQPVQQRLRAYIDAAGLEKLAGNGVAVDVQIETVLVLSERTFQVDWTETVYTPQGQQKDTSKWSGNVQLVVQLPKTKEELERNPLGIYVAHYAIAPRKSL